MRFLISKIGLNGNLFSGGSNQYIEKINKFEIFLNILQILKFKKY